LNATERNQFDTAGYAGPFSLLSPGAARDIANAVRRDVFSRPSPVPPQTKVKHRHLDSRALYEICVREEVLDRAAAIHGGDLMLWNSTLFDKQGDLPGPLAYPWHCEAYYWEIEPLESVSFWIALDDARPDNGCMEFLPGSHRWNVPAIEGPDPRYAAWFVDRRADESAFSDAGRVSLAMTAGECVMFSERLLHRSGPNTARAPRLGFAFRIAPSYVRVRHPFPCVIVRGLNRNRENAQALPPQPESPASGAAALARSIRRHLRSLVGG